jgi:hypothetical protein
MTESNSFDVDIEGTSIISISS